MSFSAKLKYFWGQPWSPDLIMYMMSLHPNFPKHTYTQRKRRLQHTIQPLCHFLCRGWFDMIHRLRRIDTDKLTRSRKEWRPSRKRGTAQDQTCLPDLQRMSEELWKNNCSVQSSNDSKYYFMQSLHLIGLCSKKRLTLTHRNYQWMVNDSCLYQSSHLVLIKLFFRWKCCHMVESKTAPCSVLKCERLKLDERTT